MISLNDKVIIAFSDTHGNHRRLQVPEDADIVICAGDAVEDDLKGGEYDDFIAWFGLSLPSGNSLFPVITNYLSAVSDIKQLSRSLRRPALLFFRMLWRNATELSLALSPEMPGLPMKTYQTILTFWSHTGHLTASWTMTWGL